MKKIPKYSAERLAIALGWTKCKSPYGAISISRSKKDHWQAPMPLANGAGLCRFIPRADLEEPDYNLARVVLEHSGLTLEEYGAAMQIGMDIAYSLTARTRLVHTQCLGAMPGQMLRAIWHALNTK